METLQSLPSRKIWIILLLVAVIAGAVLLQRSGLISGLKSSVLDPSKPAQIIAPATQGFVQDNTVFPIDFTTNYTDYLAYDRFVTFEWTSGTHLIENFSLNLDLNCSIISTSAGAGAVFPASSVKIKIPQNQPGKCAGTAIVKASANSAATLIITSSVTGSTALVFEQIMVRRINPSPIPLPQCGNGILELPEECDNGSNGDATCTNQCIRKPVAPPYCGDGVKQSGEECDDGNTNNGDQCSSICKTIPSPANYNAVFVTSSTFTGKFGGLAPMDEKCQTAAIDARLEGTWKAMVSAPKRSIEDLVYGLSGDLSTKPFLLLDATKIADHADDLLDGLLQTGITLTEKSDNYQTNHDGIVWTGSTHGGTLTSEFCQKPVPSTNTGNTGTVGDVTKLTNAFNSGSKICGESHALYCLKTSTVTPAPSSAAADEPFVGSIVAGVSKSYIPGSALQSKGLQKFEIKTNSGVTNASIRVTAHEKLRAGISMPTGNNTLPVVKSYQFEPSSSLAPEIQNAVLTIQTNRQELKYFGIKNTANLVLGHNHNGKWAAIKPRSVSEDSVTGTITLVFSINNFSDVILTTTFPSDPVCGNGSVETSEQCDDGNTANTDACLNSCRIPSCGDGFTQAGVEACDDGNNINTDSCIIINNTCAAAECGDGFIQAGVEQCDGNAGVDANLGQACELKTSANKCKIKNAIAFISAAQIPVAYTLKPFRLAQVLDFSKMGPVKTVTFSGPTGVAIQDTTGAVNDGYNREGSKSYFVPQTAVEHIFRVDVTYKDNSLPTSETFKITSPVPVCGNTIIETDEPCDDGNNVNTDACLIINSTCRAASCGDGEIRTGVEQCDGSKGIESNQTCSTDTCQLVNYLDLKTDLASLPIYTKNAFELKNVIRDFSTLKNMTNMTFSTTDSGISISNPSISYSQGYVPPYEPGVTASFIPQRKGDHLFTVSLDFKTGPRVTIPFTLTVPEPACGNQKIENNEECEDNNNVDTDACVSCKNAFCGDSKIQTNVEQCDGANGVGAFQSCGVPATSTGPNPNACKISNTVALKDPLPSLSGVQPFIMREVIDFSKSSKLKGITFWTKDTPPVQFKVTDANNQTVNIPGDNVSWYSDRDHGYYFIPNRLGTYKFSLSAYFETGEPISSRLFEITAPVAACGNGIKEAGEECDLGKDAAGNLLNSDTSACTSSCKNAVCGDGLVQNPNSAGTNEECEKNASGEWTIGVDPAANEICFGSLGGYGGISCNIRNQLKLKDVSTLRPYTNNPFFLRDAIDFSKTSQLNTLTFREVSSYGVEIKDPSLESTTGSLLPFLGKGSKAYFVPIYAGTYKFDAEATFKRGYIGNGGNRLTERFEITVPQALCGNTIKETNEQCDDGNSVNDDGCNTFCNTPSCLNGIKELGEQCDDGNVWNDDACSNSCQQPVCGDGKKQGSEACDDGNTNNTDACLNTCQPARCGDGNVRTGIEQCDDGNTVNDDACTNTCTTPRCGDTIKQGDEQCDDGNDSTADACVACQNARCGDNFVQQGIEACDLGTELNSQFGQKCLATCKEIPFPIPRKEEEWNP